MLLPPMMTMLRHTESYKARTAARSAGVSFALIGALYFMLLPPVMMTPPDDTGNEWAIATDLKITG